MAEAMVPTVLTQDTSRKELKATFARDGYLLLKNFYSTLECQQLKERMRVLIDQHDISEQNAVFSALNQQHAQDEYFRTSGDKIRFFLEKGALAADGSLTCDKHQAFNKVGHALHDLDPVFSAFSRKPALAQLSETLGLNDPLLLQSMYIFKSARIGGEVTCHQDSTFLYTEPESVLGFWVALDDANVENGCLWVTPGGHKGTLRQRFHYRDSELGMTTLDSTPFEDACMPLEAAQGSLVVLHGRLPHKSGANHSAQPRHAYTLHVIDGSCNYPADNWLQRGADMPLHGFAVNE